MRILLVITALAISLFGYKDSFYIGAFQASFSGKATIKENSLEYSSNMIDNDFDVSGKPSIGIRFGQDTNQNKEHTSKMRLELSVEPRTYTFKADGKEVEISGNRAVASAYFGKNLDLLLNHETTVYFKLGFGYNSVEKLGKGTDEVFGVGGIYTTRLFEFQFGIEKEFRRWGALTLVPYDFFASDKHVEETDLIYGGINIRF